MSVKLALQADVWYNTRVNIVVVQQMLTHPLNRLIHLDWRCIMDMIPQDNTPRKQCTGSCKRWLPATTEFFPRRKSSKSGIYPKCNQCRREESKVYRKEHPEIDKAYRQSHLNEITDYKKQYRETHHEERKQYDKEHQDRINELRRIRAKEKADHIRAVHKQYCDTYYKTERGLTQMRVSSGNRRARKRAAQGTYTTQELEQQYARQKGKCYYCTAKLGKGRSAWVAEHVIPLSRGGHNSIDNIVIACPTCNLRKHDKLPHEWEDGGRLL